VLAAGGGALVLATAFPGVANANNGNLIGGIGALLNDPPFSFTLDGQHSSQLLKRWRRAMTTTTAGRTKERDVTWTAPGSELRVRWRVVEHLDYPHLCWTVEIENSGTGPSGVISDLLAVDLEVAKTAPRAYTVRTGIGSHQDTRDFQPLEVLLEPSSHRLFTTHGGRPTSFDTIPSAEQSFLKTGWPYYNIDWGTSGVIVALGWPGQWAMELSRGAGSDLTIRGGMVNADDAAQGARIDDLELTSTWLEQGETIRTPMVVLQPWREKDGWIAAQNTWRRWMVDVQQPRDQGRPPQPVLSGTHFRFSATAQDQLDWIDTFAEKGLTRSTGGDFDRWWIDAGWYESADTSATGWIPVGTWEPSSTRYPDGFTPVTDRVKELGMSTILWFEPERVRLGTWLADHHPEWLLSAPEGYVSFLGSTDDRLLDFGDPQARAWITQHVTTTLADQGVTDTAAGVSGYYREDFNIDPLPYWNHSDEPGRRGIHQIHHVLGHLEYWKAIRAAHPQLMIDTCASGGRRLDVESLSLSLPLLRSDMVRPAITGQCQSYGLSLWLPIAGNQAPANVDPGNGYVHRSSFAPMLCLPLNAEDPSLDWDAVAPLTQEWRSIADSYRGDFYPLTPYSTDPDAWMAWQLNERDGRKGFVQAFNRTSGSTVETRLHPLTGLRRNASYRVTTRSGSNNSWTASSGFSDLQGQNQWSYQHRAIGTDSYGDNTYLTGAWFGPLMGNGGYVAAGSMHADEQYDAVRTWTAPVSGVITVTGRVAKQLTSNGDGVLAIVQRNDEVLWQQEIAFDDAVGFSTDDALGHVEVAAGDRIRFIVNCIGNYSSDAVFWDPAIRVSSLSGGGVTTTTMTGASLMSNGLPVSLGATSAATIAYEQI